MTRGRGSVGQFGVSAFDLDHVVGVPHVVIPMGDERVAVSGSASFMGVQRQHTDALDEGQGNHEKDNTTHDHTV